MAMKFVQLRAFEKHLATTDTKLLSSVYFIIGKEDFERRIALDALIKRLLPNESDRVHALCSLNAEQVSAAKIDEELNGLSLFSANRTLVVHITDKIDKDITKALEGYFGNPNPSLCVIISAQTINRATNLYKKGEKVGIVLDLVEEKPKDKAASTLVWLQSYVAQSGKSIDNAASQLLMKLLGTAQADLYSEVTKLICFVGERKQITSDDISKTVKAINIENCWDLSTALFNRNGSSGLRISSALLSQGTAFFALLRLLRTQFQTEFQICSILEQGGSPDEISKLFPYMRGYVLERHIEMARGYGFKRFKQALQYIDETEALAKNSGLEPELLMELLVIKLVA